MNTNSTFESGVATQNPFSHTGGSYFHIGMMDHPRYPISELQFGKFPDPVEFHSWKVYLKSVVCSKSAYLHLTVHRIKEVEIAKSIDDSDIAIDYRAKRPLRLRYACALKSLLDKHVHFRRKSKCR